MLLLMLAACASNIHALYEAEKAAVMAAPPAAPADFDPELRVRIGEVALDGLAEQAIAAGLLDFDQEMSLKNPLGFRLALTPHATVQDLTLSPSSACEACLEVHTTLEGKARWEAGAASGKVPFTAKVEGTLAFQLSESGSGAYAVVAHLKDLGKVRLESSKAGSVDVSDLLGDWTRAALKKTPAIDLGTFGGADLPLRAARLGSSPGAIELQALLNVSGGSPVAAARAAPTTGFEVRLHPDTALALMRREAFEAGTLQMDVAVDPRSLTVDGQRFTLGIRLWRLAGAGWWRDYTVTGGLKVKGKSIALNPEAAEEGEKSRGAGLADPLALLVEGKILDAVLKGTKQAVPAGTSTKLGDQRLRAKVSSVEGVSGALVLSGSLDLEEPGSGRAPGGSAHPKAGARTR